LPPGVADHSQFFPRLWHFKVSSRQRASGPVLGIVWGSLLAIAAVVILVVRRAGWQQQDPQDWAWIDVVRSLLNRPSALPPGVADHRDSSTLWAM